MRAKGMPYVYILKSLKDYKQYIGSTINLENRIIKHNNGYVISTKHRRPLVLIGYQITRTMAEARLLEMQYKRSHGALDRAKKNGNFIIISYGV